MALLMIALPMCSGIRSQFAREARIANAGAAEVAKIRERSFMLTCPRYAEANIIWKLTTLRKYSWCDEYLDRLP